eukprot:GHVR01181510.1.p1 GENE.GHVR01181510.1~~GHVR01181510.1.p1  ORF type:complete len:245 (-),score=44.18 GHVR01181510.1:71-805(-)
MTEVSHPNVMGVLDIYSEKEWMFLVMDFMKSDLKKFIEKQRTPTLSQVKCIMQQVLSGLAALHKWYFIHRDIAPANIFINSEGVCKIGDFGLSRRHASPNVFMTPRVVTLWYRAPELLFGAKFYGEGVDIWSAGCILAELIKGQPLFCGMSELDTLGSIFAFTGTPSQERWPGATSLPLYCDFEYRDGKDYRIEFPSASTEAIDLISKLLQLDPNMRPSAEQALSHEFFHTLPPPCEPHELNIF